ncbi:MAG TPA: pyridoxal phosphate-dependent aminotransferase [Anaeromyxobacteraceae bacterium]
MSARPVPLSRRVAWDLAANRLAARLEALRDEGRPLLDLTETNPTRCGLAWPAEALAAALAHPALARYEPAPAGAPAARQAVSGYLAGHGAAVPPERVLLTASTSEGYALLLKLLCDPGDEVVAPAPSYPLLDLLCDLEGVRLRRYPLRYDGAWHVDLAALAAAVGERTRAVVVVSPSNPVGAVLAAEELAALEALCAERGLALLGDEVFLDTAGTPASSVATARRCLAFHLSGLSKVCGLPQLKAAWIAAAGPEREVARALARLEVVADTYLSVSGPAQAALPALLQAREGFLGPLRERLTVNRAALARAAGDGAPFDALPGGGGWTAVVRAGEALDEEAIGLELLEEGVVVQPGFFYDFERSGYFVVSLLPEPARFARGVAALARRLRAAAG